MLESMLLKRPRRGKSRTNQRGILKVNDWLFLVVLAFLGGFTPSASAITVHSVAELSNAVAAANAGGDKDIRIAADGSPYDLNGVYLRLTGDNITVSGATGNRGDAILDGSYVTTEILQVTGSNVTIQDLTLMRPRYHAIHVAPESKDVSGTRIENVHVIDPGQQAIKINQNSAKTFSARVGVIRKSRLELTAAGRQQVWNINGSCYTGGVDTHHGLGWTVSNNIITGFWCGNGLSEHGIHFWSFSENTLVEKNLIINCDRGIGFGLGSSGHIGGVIRNNMIYHDIGHDYSDVGVSLESASNALVYNNTIYQRHAYPNAIEYRFQATTGGSVYNNLTNKQIVSRDGGRASLSNNVTNASSAYFVDVASGNLHLAYRVPGVVDNGIKLAGLTDDYDGEIRTGNIDIGADEFAGNTKRSQPFSWLRLLLD